MMQEVLLAGSRVWSMLIPLCCLAAGQAPAAGEDFQGRPVAAIAFEPAEQPLPPSEVTALIPLKEGEPLRLSDVRESIARLFATGRYSDIVVEAEPAGEQVEVRFRTRGNWFVGQVTVSDVNAPPSATRMINAAELRPGAELRPRRLEEAASRLRSVLADNGYFEATVEPQVRYEHRTQQAHVHFEVSAGRRAILAEPVIEGEPLRAREKIVGATRWKGWFGWRAATEERVQSGLDRLLASYRKDGHLMARVNLEEMKYDPVSRAAAPVVRVTEGPKVNVEVTGAKVSRGRLRQLLPIFEERSVDRDLLTEGVRNLTEYFQSRGYYNAKADFTVESGPGGVQHIIYHIDRGERCKLTHLDIRGNRYFDTATLRERMFVAPASPQLRRGRYSASMLERDREAITNLYRANGFRETKVSTQLIEDYRGRRGEVAVAVNISEGPQWFVSRVDFAGVPPELEQRFRAMLQSGPGQPFSEINIAADRDNILAYYFNQGFQSASFEHQFREADEPQQVILRYEISEGPRRQVREVLVAGLSTTRPRLVDDRISIKPGDPLSQTQMIETQRRLYDLGVFAKVDLAVQNPEGEEPAKYVLVQLEESRKYSLAAGFGAEIARIGGSQYSLEAPAGEAGFSPRVSFDVSRLNFLGRAHTVSLRTRVSSLQKRVLTTYLAPQVRGWRNVDVSFTTLFDDSRDVRTFSARRWEASTQVTHRWTRSKTLFYRFAYRRVAVDEGTLKIDRELIPLLSQPVRVGVLSGAYVDDRRDDPVDSHRGTYNSLDLSLASRIFGSETDYFRLLGRNSTYHRIGAKLVLARTLSFGMMTALRARPELPPSPQDIPLPERFFGGGASLHRAFPENQAGPRDLVTGFPLGGKALLAIGTEIRFPLFGRKIGGVLFHDAGNVYSSVSDISFRWRQRNKADFDYMVHAVGFGVRYRTPVGPVRADFGFAPNSPRFYGCRGTPSELVMYGCTEKTDQRIDRFQFHFSLGQSF